MTLNESIDAQLTGNAGVAAIAGTRVYFASPPKAAPRPLVIYSRASNERRNIHGGDYIDKPVYDVGGWVNPGSDPEALGDAITAALHNFGGLLGGVGGVAVEHIVRTNERTEVLDLGDQTFLVGSVITFEFSIGGNS